MESLRLLGGFLVRLSIFAEGEATLLEIRWQGLRELRNYDEGWRRIINQRYRETALRTHLNETPMFKGLSDEVMKKLLINAYLRPMAVLNGIRPLSRLATEALIKNPLLLASENIQMGYC